MMLGELIPRSFFEARGDLLLWLILAGGIALLVYGADRVVASAVKLAAAVGLSKIIIGATVVSLGTTTPEAVVSVKAAWEGNPGLALGNGVGSIICDTALIFGLCCLIRRLPLDRFVLNRHGWLQLGAGTLLTLTALGLWAISGDINAVEIPRLVGVLFVALLICYMLLSVQWSREHPEMLPLKAAAGGTASHRLRVALGNLILLIFGLALVVGGAELLIGSVHEICIRLKVPQAVIAVTLVAFGTSLPELATAVASIVKGHAELLVGNIVGADILNVLFVIGASAVAQPLKVHPIFFQLIFPVMMLVLILLRAYIFTSGSTFRRWQGIPLLVIYVIFTALAVKFGVMG
ncbi:MAG: calcium/sodium antiporter [Planctomycetota bacterium]|jgi:cation:H+ antiporter